MAEVPAPSMQPSSVATVDGQNIREFTSNEILWWNNGIWGEAGYAIPNDGGKPTSGNERLRKVVKFLGAELFNLMHKDDVKFSRPFNVAWLRAFVKALDIGMKRLGDAAVNWNQERSGDFEHSSNTPTPFLLYPVPYFGARVRQEDALMWCGRTLQLLGEIMQHSDNDYDDDVTNLFVFPVQKKLLQMKREVGMFYFNKTREEVEADTWTITEADFASYNPATLFTERELMEERAPNFWWPNTNDLTPIQAIPANVAKLYADRFPTDVGFDGDGGAVETAFPGAVLVANPLR